MSSDTTTDTTYDPTPDPVTCHGSLLIDSDGTFTFCDEGDDEEARAGSAGLSNPWRVIPLEVTAQPFVVDPTLSLTVPDPAPAEPASITAG